MKRFKGEEWQAIVKRCNRVAELLWEDGPVRRLCNCVFAVSGIVIAAALLLVTRVHPLTAIFAAFVGATIYESVRYAVAGEARRDGLRVHTLHAVPCRRFRRTRRPLGRGAVSTARRDRRGFTKISLRRHPKRGLGLLSVGFEVHEVEECHTIRQSVGNVRCMFPMLSGRSSRSVAIKHACRSKPF